MGLGRWEILSPATNAFKKIGVLLTDFRENLEKKFRSGTKKAPLAARPEGVKMKTPRTEWHGACEIRLNYLGLFVRITIVGTKFA